MNKFFLFSLLFSGYSIAQSFAPAPGMPGSTAIHKDSSIISGWASGITVKRGYLDISEPQLGSASFGQDQNGLIAEGDGLSVVTLGDSGVAVLTFNAFIFDGPGPDFAVFENGFTDHYMEFAHVEVSSDGVNFFRFPSVSETPLNPQINNFTFGNCGYIHNLAGKYRQGFGTPFDLSELSGVEGLDINHITHIKLIDVIGSVDSEFGSTDSFGNLINDPYPTAFDAGGFDLDGVAAIHTMPLNVEENLLDLKVYPNPSQGNFSIHSLGASNIQITDTFGKIVYFADMEDTITCQLDIPAGFYFLEINKAGMKKAVKIVINK